MQCSARPLSFLVSVAVLAAACGGAPGPAVGGLGDGSDDVLSSCEPASGTDTATLVEPGGPRPPLSVMQQALADSPDAEPGVKELIAQGQTRSDALHAMYAQVVGQRLFADVQQLPGYVTGAYARPLQGEPFQLSFSGPVPEQLDPDAYDLDSFGLQVTTGAVGLDDEAMVAAVEAVGEVGMRMVSASGDEAIGTARIEVLDATPEQVTAWEQAVEDRSRWCLVRAARTVACDDSVIATARQSARQGEVLANQQTGEPPSPQRADQVRRSHLGLTLPASRAKAAREGRAIRVVVRDGVALGATDDLDPGRLNLTVCDGVVVDTRMDLEPDR